MISLSLTHTVEAFNPDSHFNTSALSRLEAVGIPVVTSLMNSDSAQLGVFIGQYWKGTYEDAMRFWLTTPRKSCPPSWGMLFQVLRRQGLGRLAQQIQDYLTSKYSTVKPISGIGMGGGGLYRQRQYYS